MSASFALAGALIVVALALALVALGLLHFADVKGKSMSLVQDAEAVFAKIKAAVEGAVKPLHDRIAELEAEVADKASELEAAMTENGGLIAELGKLGEDVVAMIAPASTVEPVEAQPAA